MTRANQNTGPFVLQLSPRQMVTLAAGSALRWRRSAVGLSAVVATAARSARAQCLLVDGSSTH